MDKTLGTRYPGYQQAQTAPVFFQLELPGYIRISGNDRRDFLQRQSTNDINLISPEKYIVTVLTSPAARIHDVLTVIDEGDNLGVLTLPGQGMQTLDFLRGRIFFMDKVSLEDVSQEYNQLELMGPGSVELIHHLVQSKSLEIGDIYSVEINDAPVRIFFQGERAYRLLYKQIDSQLVTSSLIESGAVQLTPETFNILRIEGGYPAAGHELTENYTPLETGLDWAISSDKGCYTGQEVIARQVNYDKITRHLVGVRFSEEPKLGESLYPLDNNQPVGKITSTALSPRFGFIALAIVKRPYDQPGSELRLGNEEAGSVGRISSLPFQDE